MSHYGFLLPKRNSFEALRIYINKNKTNNNNDINSNNNNGQL